MLFDPDAFNINADSWPSMPIAAAISSPETQARMWPEAEEARDHMWQRPGHSSRGGADSRAIDSREATTLSGNPFQSSSAFSHQQHLDMPWGAAGMQPEVLKDQSYGNGERGWVSFDHGQSAVPGYSSILGDPAHFPLAPGGMHSSANVNLAARQRTQLPAR